MSDENEVLTSLFSHANPPADPVTEAYRNIRTEETEEPVEDQEDFAGTVDEPSDVGDEYKGEDFAEYEQRLIDLEKRLKDKDSHIGTLEAENKVWREVAPKREPEPVAKPPVELDPMDDPATQELMRKAMEEDPVATLKVIRDSAVAKAQKTIDARFQPLEQERQQATQYQAIQQNLVDELKTAYNNPRSKVIIDEAVSNNWQSGRLVDLLRNNQDLLQWRGGVTGAVSMLALEADTGAPVAQESTPPPAPAQPNPASRGKARNVASPSTTDEEADPLEAFKNSIVNANMGKLPI